MTSQELKSKFTEEFFDEFQFDAEFRSLFKSMDLGMSPFQAIEHLCKSKKELFKALETALANMPKRLILTTEQIEQLNINKNK